MATEASTTQAQLQPRRLSRVQKVGLVLEIVATHVRAWRSLRRDGLEITLAVLRAGAGAPAGEPPDRGELLEAVRLADVVRRVLRLLPVDSRCLSQSLVLCRLLANRGQAGRLVIGVRPGENFGAHAWVELGGRALLPTGEGEFERLVAL